MKFKSFESKIEEGTIDPIDLLVHYVSICDIAINKNIEDNNWDIVAGFLDRIQEAGDRMISVTYGLLENDEGENHDGEINRNPIGFQQKPTIERDDAEDSESDGLQQPNARGKFGRGFA